jgi:hypothetical protein
MYLYNLEIYQKFMNFLQCQAYRISLEIPLFHKTNENLDVVEETKNFRPGIQLLSAWIRRWYSSSYLWDKDASKRKSCVARSRDMVEPQGNVFQSQPVVHNTKSCISFRSIERRPDGYVIPTPNVADFNLSRKRFCNRGFLVYTRILLVVIVRRSQAFEK